MRRLIADQRGVVSFEVPAVWIFLMTWLLLPLADVAVAGFKFMSAKQALRNFGQSIQYSTPPNLTDLSAGGWLSAAQAKAAIDTRYPISDPQVSCGDAVGPCTDPTLSPKYYKFSTTVTLTPIVPLITGQLLCTSGVGNGCTFTLFYSERFQ